MQSPRQSANFFAALFVFSILFLGSSWGQTTITGRVTDEENKALELVAIANTATGKGTVSGIDGSFSIRVQEKDSVQLRFRTLGYVQLDIWVKL